MYPLIQKRLLTLEFEEKFSRYVSFVCKSKIDVQFWRWRKNGKILEKNCVVLSWGRCSFSSFVYFTGKIWKVLLFYLSWQVVSLQQHLLFGLFWLLTFCNITVCNFAQILLHHFLPICTIGIHVNRHFKSEFCFC